MHHQSRNSIEDFWRQRVDEVNRYDFYNASRHTEDIFFRRSLMREINRIEEDIVRELPRQTMTLSLASAF